MVRVSVFLVIFFFLLHCFFCSGSSWEKSQLFDNANVTCNGMSGDGKFGVVGTAGGGLLRSEDYGATFQLITSDTDIWSSVVMNSDGQYAVAAGNASISTSSNFGYYWEPGATSIPSAYLAMSASGQYVYLTSEYIWSSSDRGNSVTKSLDVFDDWKSIKTDSTGQYVIAASATFIYYSTDYGLSWMLGFVNIQSWNAPRFLSLAMTSYGVSAYVGTEDGWVYGTYDRGATWYSLTAIGVSGMPIYALACDSDGRRMLAGSDRVYQSSGFGYGWSETDLPIAHAWLSLSVSSDGEHATAIVDDGTGNRTLYYSTNSPFPAITSYDDDDFGNSGSSGLSTTGVIIISTVVGGFPFVGVFIWLCVMCLKMRNAKLAPMIPGLVDQPFGAVAAVGFVHGNNSDVEQPYQPHQQPIVFQQYASQQGQTQVPTQYDNHAYPQSASQPHAYQFQQPQQAQHLRPDPVVFQQHVHQVGQAQPPTQYENHAYPQSASQPHAYQFQQPQQAPVFQSPQTGTQSAYPQVYPVITHPVPASHAAGPSSTTAGLAVYTSASSSQATPHQYPAVHHAPGAAGAPAIATPSTGSIAQAHAGGGGASATTAQHGAASASLESRVTRAELPPLASRFVFDEATGQYVHFDPSHGAQP